KDPTYTASNAAVPMLVVHYSDGEGSYKVPVRCFPPGNITVANIQSDTTPDEVAIQFTAPVACRLVGFYWSMSESESTAEVDFDLLDNDETTPASLLTNPTTIVHDAIKFSNIGFTSFNVEPESLTAEQVVNL